MEPAIIGDHWQRWIDWFENLLTPLSITDDKQRKALLLHYTGDKGYNIYPLLEGCSDSATSGPTQDLGQSASGTPNSTVRYSPRKQYSCGSRQL